MIRWAGSLPEHQMASMSVRTAAITGVSLAHRRCPSTAREILSLAVITDAINYTGTLLIGTRGAGIYTLDIASGIWPTNTIKFPGDSRAQTIQVLLSASDGTGTAYAGTVDHGAFVIRDGGQVLEPKVNGLPWTSRSILALARDPADGTVYAGTYGDGVYKLSRGSAEWEPAKGTPPRQELPVDFSVQKVAFVGRTAICC